MPRQSISLTPPNDAWLRAQVESEEFTSKSEVVNDLIRKAREIETIRARLIMTEHSGLTTQGRADILADIKEEARRDGDVETDRNCQGRPAPYLQLNWATGRI